MLFYNKEDMVCTALNEAEYRVLYTGDMVFEGEKCYKFDYPFFYHMVDVDGDIYRGEGRTHARHMGIKEWMESGFSNKR